MKLPIGDGRKDKVDGCVLLLDELPKIDPNTAGILNDALAKVKVSTNS
jgi:MoxR-like ATPase